MEIIIHGKPYSDSHRQSGGLDETFVSSFASTFFKDSGRLLKDMGSDEALIVDARNWRGRWYGVYTYTVRVTDFANTPCVYLAISAVFTDEYDCFTRDVYAKLKKACTDYVIGRYLSANGKYLVQDFADIQLFNGLVAFIRNNWDPIVETFDNGFIPQGEFRNNVLYNIDDCDSKAFLNAWRECGRIIITPNTPSKDTLLKNVAEAQSICRSQKNTINDLKQKLQEAQQKEQTYIGNSGKQKKETERLKAENEGLKKDRENLTNSLQEYARQLGTLKNGFNELTEKFTRLMAGRFPANAERVPKGGGKVPDKGTNKGSSTTWLSWITLAVLLVSVVLNAMVLGRINVAQNAPKEHVDTVRQNQETVQEEKNDSVFASETQQSVPEVEYKIDIPEKRSGENLTVGESYTLVLKQRNKGERKWADCTTTPTWLIDGVLGNNQLTSNKPKSVSVSCIVEGKEVVRQDNPLKFVNPPQPKKKVASDKTTNTNVSKTVSDGAGGSHGKTETPSTEKDKTNSQQKG